MGGWMDGWMDGRAGLRINNQKDEKNLEKSQKWKKVVRQI